MAALTSIVVSNAAANGVTITFNAAAIDCTPYQLRQLVSVLQKASCNCTAAEGPTPTLAATVSVPASFGT